MPAAYNPQNRRAVGVRKIPDSLCRLPSAENPCRLRAARCRLEGVEHSRRYVVVSRESSLSSWLPVVQLADLCHGRQLAPLEQQARRSEASGQRSAADGVRFAASAAALGEVRERARSKCRRSTNLPSAKPTRVVKRSGFMVRRGRTVEATRCRLTVALPVAAVPRFIRSASGSSPLARVGPGTALPVRVGFALRLGFARSPRGWWSPLPITIGGLVTFCYIRRSSPSHGRRGLVGYFIPSKLYRAVLLAWRGG